MKYYKVTLLFLALCPLLSIANGFPIEKVTKKIHKEIDVNPNAIVEIENQFGDISITTWDQNKVIIDILISVEGRSTQKINEKLQNIDVVFDLGPDLVRAITKINNRWGVSWMGTTKVKFKIDYTIKMPATNEVDLENDYGVIALNYLEGRAKLSWDYGKIIIGELMADNNQLSFDYTSNSNIEYIAGGEINADYSGFEVTEAGYINLNSDYTSSYFEIIDSLNFNNDYGKLKIEKARSIEGNGDYLTFQLGKITNFLKLNNEFGSIRISEIFPTTKRIAINAEYTGIHLGIDQDWAFRFELNLEFAGLRHDLDLYFNEKIIESNEKYYQGHHIDEETTNTLKIDSEFGSIKLYPSSKK